MLKKINKYISSRILYIKNNNKVCFKNIRALGIFGDNFDINKLLITNLINEFSPIGFFVKNIGIKNGNLVLYFNKNNKKFNFKLNSSDRKINKFVMKKYIKFIYTIYYPSCKKMFTYDAIIKYISNNIPILIFAGHKCGNKLLKHFYFKMTNPTGINLIIAKSFNDMYRLYLLKSNILPLEFLNINNLGKIKISGKESFDIYGLKNNIYPKKKVKLIIYKKNTQIISLNLIIKIYTFFELSLFFKKK